ncbi:hypothetical protein C2845_PM15G00310 [Panicum miliaceum]|uniref:Transposase (putative) gypsy type domain-containing protein n=1 Tax=Panicum miliaceum TaxID=4540 RepID=A0A3L6QBU5_PANMI|nr:hypothetical protein C2845_PM15G00310 [Panicum miliaceum]
MVVFQSFYEKGFGLPSGAFFRGLLHYYRLEAMHLKPISIAQIATFIHLCEGFLGIAPHFNLWRTLYHLWAYPNKDTPDVVGGAAFSLRQDGKYPEASFKDNNKRWEKKPAEEEMVEVEVLLAELQGLKAEKLTGVTVALSFAKRLI